MGSNHGSLLNDILDLIQRCYRVIHAKVIFIGVGVRDGKRTRVEQAGADLTVKGGWE